MSKHNFDDLTDDQIIAIGERNQDQEYARILDIWRNEMSNTYKQMLMDFAREECPDKSRDMMKYFTHYPYWVSLIQDLCLAGMRAAFLSTAKIDPSSLND